MSLRNNPDRKGKNHIGAKDRIEANEQKRCKVTTCDAFRHGFTGYCSTHDNNTKHYGDPLQSPIRVRDDLSPYYRATLAYIEEHEGELGEALELAEEMIRYPSLIKYHSVTEMERWLSPKDYRDNGYPITHHIIEILMRWKKDTRGPKHFLASIIAPHVFSYQEPKRLLSGRPVHVLITRSVILQCRAEYTWELLTGLKFEKIRKPHYVSPRNKANTGLRLTSMFTKAIAQVYKEVPKVIDDEAIEKREKLEYYKMFEKMHKSGDQRVTKGDLERLRGNLGL